MQRLIPGPPAPTSIDEAYGAPLGSRSDRPWVGLCMVASIDGSTAVDGASAQLGNANDSAVLKQLRSNADVIIVGAGTARAECYGPPSKRGQRIGIVTASARVDVNTQLFDSGAGFLITTTSAPVAASVDTVRAGDDAVDLLTALLALGTVCDDPRVVQCEGGPSLNGSLFTRDLVDEINITTSPLVVGGDGARLATRAEALARPFELQQLLIDDESFVFSRWLRKRRDDG
ncbi:MAG: dihydrofolate reductase family protein [Ilumatobacteraceae bacterium]